MVAQGDGPQVKQRKRSADRTRDDILASARTQFATLGYDRTTTRSIAAAAGVDAALVNRYFGSKKALFAHTVDRELNYPDLGAEADAEPADLLVEAAFRAFGIEGTLLALMRTAASNDEAALLMREVLVERGRVALGKAAADDHQDLRSALVGSVIVGFAFNRWVLGVPALTALDSTQVADWLRPVFEALLGKPPPPAREL